MKFLDKNVALCLVPHPDDTAISMSNLVKRFFNTTFHMVYMSMGTDTDPTTGMLRMEEENKFWEMLGVRNIVQHALQSKFYISTMSSYITELDKLISTLPEIDIIFSPSQNDSHYEHKFTSTLVYSVSRFIPCTVIEYKTASSLHAWTPNFFVDITEMELKNKIQCLRDAFASQRDATYFTTDSLVSFHTDFINMKRNYKLSETFALKQFYW